jgi:hypothetical protein
VNVLVGPKIGGSLRAFGLIGGGLIGGFTNFAGIFKVSGDSRNAPVITGGGGVMADLGRRFGVRFDVQRVIDVGAKHTDDRYGFNRISASAFLKF